MKRFKIQSWDRRKEKKARFKRKIQRILKRGGHIYGGWLILNGDELVPSMDSMIKKQTEELAAAAAIEIDNTVKRMIEEGAGTIWGKPYSRMTQRNSAR